MAKRAIYEVEYLYACTGAVMGASCFVYAKNAREAHFIWLVLATARGWNYADLAKSGYWEMCGDIKKVERHNGCVYDMNDAVEGLNGPRGEYLYAVLPRCPGTEVPVGMSADPDACYHKWKSIVGEWAEADFCCTKCGSLKDEYGVWKANGKTPKHRAETLFQRLRKKISKWGKRDG